jgi:hypothetical protein
MLEPDVAEPFFEGKPRFLRVFHKDDESFLF